MNSDYLRQAVRELRNDAKMHLVIERVGQLHPLKLQKDPFQKLSRSIVGQQLSTKAAASIYTRILSEIAGGKKLLPEDVLDADIEELRQAGLSYQKAAYLKNLAEHVVENNLHARSFTKHTNEEIIEALTTIKGIGRWTVEMYLMFGLGRPDVLPVDDLGIKKGFQKVYHLRSLPDADKMQKLAQGWNGHLTVGSLYLWRSLDNKPN